MMNLMQKTIPLALSALLGLSTGLSARGHHFAHFSESYLAPLPASGHGHKAQKPRYAGWYMRIRVQATAEDGTKYAHNTGGVFGELKQSKNGKDRHDIPTFAPAIFHVVFPHYYWKEASGDYDSDYRKWTRKQTRRRRVWTFQVKNQKGVDLSDAPLQIRIDDPVKVLAKREQGNRRYIESKGNPKMKRRFTLVDVDNHTTYGLDELADAQLSMDGKHTRTFRLVRGQVRERDFRPVKSPR